MFYFSENSAVYEIIREKYGIAGQATDDNMTRCMHIACWVTKTIDTHTQNKQHLLLSTATMVGRTRLNVPLQVHCLSSCIIYDCGQHLIQEHVPYFCYTCLFPPVPHSSSVDRLATTSSVRVSFTLLPRTIQNSNVSSFRAFQSTVPTPNFTQTL